VRSPVIGMNQELAFVQPHFDVGRPPPLFDLRHARFEEQVFAENLPEAEIAEQPAIRGFPR
jgi:hypothetical protein